MLQHLLCCFAISWWLVCSSTANWPHNDQCTSIVFHLSYGSWCWRLYDSSRISFRRDAIHFGWCFQDRETLHPAFLAVRWNLSQLSVCCELVQIRWLFSSIHKILLYICPQQHWWASISQRLLWQDFLWSSHWGFWLSVTSWFLTKQDTNSFSCCSSVRRCYSLKRLVLSKVILLYSMHWIPMRALTCFMKFVNISFFKCKPFNVLIFSLNTSRLSLQLNSLLLILARPSAPSLRESEFGNSSSRLFWRCRGNQAVRDFNQVLFVASITVFRMLIMNCGRKSYSPFGYWPLGKSSSSALCRWRIESLIRRRSLPTFTI